MNDKERLCVRCDKVIIDGGSKLKTAQCLSCMLNSIKDYPINQSLTNDYQKRKKEQE